MRAVHHANVVELRAFFYSNGDKVSSCPQVVLKAVDDPPTDIHVLPSLKRTRCTSI